MIQKKIEAFLESINCELMLIHSDIAYGFPLNNYSSRKQILEDHLVSLKNLGPKFWMPTFNYNFCHGTPHNTESTVSKTGVLTEYFRKNEAQWRTPIPVFSFAGTGKNPNISITEVIDPFGDNSAFAYLYQKKATLFYYGAGFNVSTILHYAESLTNILFYRYDKQFKGKVITENTEQDVQLKFHVRPMNKHLDYDWVKIENELYEVGLLRKFTQDKSSIIICPVFELINFWLEKLKDNSLYFLDKESLIWVKPKLDSLGRPFQISDFE